MSWSPLKPLKGPKVDRFFKIIVLGDGFVGKTAITTQFCEDKFDSDYKMTIGVNFGEKRFRYGPENLAYIFSLWDVAGQERFRILRTEYYAGAQAALLVYDMTNRLTFLDLYNWIVEVQKIVGNIPMVVVGNKLDLVSSGSRAKDSRTRQPYKKEVAFIEGKYFADSINGIFLETSAKKNYNIDNLFSMTVEIIEGDVQSTRISALDPFKSVTLGFETIEQLITSDDNSKIYDALIKLKQSIFDYNPYSVVLGNLTNWIQIVPNLEFTYKVKAKFIESVDAWRAHYRDSISEGKAVTSRI